jgi:hypothetical protein
VAIHVLQIAAKAQRIQDYALRAHRALKLGIYREIPTTFDRVKLVDCTNSRSNFQQTSASGKCRPVCDGGDRQLPGHQNLALRLRPITHSADQ